jgi:hypothetical protein
MSDTFLYLYPIDPPHPALKVPGKFKEDLFWFSFEKSATPITIYLNGILIILSLKLKVPSIGMTV